VVNDQNMWLERESSSNKLARVTTQRNKTKTAIKKDVLVMPDRCRLIGNYIQYESEFPLLGNHHASRQRAETKGLAMRFA
jgi:hypothetical protein